MVERKNLVAVGPEDHGGNADPVDETADVAAPLETSADEYLVAEDEWAEDEPVRRLGRFDWAVPTLAVLAVLGWTGFFGWVHQRTLLAGASPAQWAEWVVDWSVPVLLVVALWLLAMRNSRREAARFGAAAQTLAQESALLERRLVTVNRELSLARDFIAAQSRDLESLGRTASDRISQHADRLQGLIHDNGAQVEAIGRVSTTALENMDRLRDDLPVISNSARDVASQIGHAGGVAKEQLEELVSGFNRLNQFGEASGRQVASLRGKVDEALTAFGEQAAQLEQITTARFAELAERSTAFRAELDGREVETFAAIRRRADALSDELSSRRHEIEAAETAALEALQARLSQLRDDGVRMAESLRTGENEAAESWSAAVFRLEERMVEAVRRVSEVDQHAMENAQKRLDALRTQATRVDEAIFDRNTTFEKQLEEREALAAEREAEALAALHERLAAFDAQITERQQDYLAHVAGLAERGDALAERLSAMSADMDHIAIQGRQTQDGLAEAAAGLTARLAESRAAIDDSAGKVARLTDDSVRLLELIRSSAEHTRSDLPEALAQAEHRLVAFEQQASSLRDLISQTGERGAALAQHVETARNNGTATLEQMTELEQRLAELAQRSDALAAQAQGELSSAIASLEKGSANALGNLQSQQAEAIRELAERIGADSSAAIDETLRAHAAQAIAELEQAAEKASEAGREAAVQLRDQLSVVNELAGNLERRVAHARQRAEEQVDNDFARRMALITESLNSSAIDISKAFSTEVTDTAWASYLRGDRGIFTRRAVRLLDHGEARAVADIYQEDADFRETVNRYIHDFEAMLRSVLSTRDGHSLAVTLLSSDMGKLYVALAQAIERLRA
jgi:chromosome segregation ATPase